MDFEDFLKTYQKVPVEEFPNTVLRDIPQPMVSCRVSTYMHADFIRDCLDGILMQKTDFPFEIIIGEDESSDGTREICMEYANKFPDKIRLFLHSRKNNIKIDGRPSPRFQGTHTRFHCRGKYQAICEGDDYWTDTDKLQKQVDFMEANPDYSYSFHGWVILKDGQTKPGLEIQKGDRSLTLLIRAESLIDLEPTPQYVKTGDVLFKFHLRAKGKSKYLENIKPAVYRHHSGGIWSMIGELEKKNNRIATYGYLYHTYKNTKYSKGLQSILISLQISRHYYILKFGRWHEKPKSMLWLTGLVPYKILLLLTNKNARERHYIPLINPNASNPKEYSGG